MGEKTVHKKLPFDRWRIEEMRSYFEDMSANGLHVRELEGNKNEFEVGEPETFRYRIDVARKNYGKFRKEQLEFYAKAGWKHIGWVDGYHLYRSTEPGPFPASLSPSHSNRSLDSSEPFDPNLLVKCLKRKAILDLLRSMLFSIGAVIAIFSLLYLNIRIDQLSPSVLGQAGILFFLFISDFMKNISMFQYVRELGERIERGTFFAERIPYEDEERKYKLGKAAAVVFSISLVLLQFVPDLMEVLTL